MKNTGGWHTNVTKMPFYHHERDCVTQIATDNDVPRANTRLLSATADNLAALDGGVDLIYSHMSWGFHYPVSTYASAAFKALRPGGTLLITVIKKFWNSRDGCLGNGKRLKPEDEIEHARSVGFRCTIMNGDSGGYRAERLHVVRCMKP